MESRICKGTESTQIMEVPMSEEGERFSMKHWNKEILKVGKKKGGKYKQR